MKQALCLCVTTGASGGSGSGEAAVRSALKDYMERLPEPFVLLEIEQRIKEKTPYVVVALQEVCCCPLGAPRTE